MSHDNRYVVAYSGGLDSHVLLHAAASLRNTFAVRAIHIHHGLHPNADHWEAHCQNVCAGLKIPLISQKITIDRKGGDSLEALARHLRYKTLMDLLDTDEILLTAHTEDDQAETLLLQLLRGAGIKGLASMPSKSHRLLRPLLEFTRHELLTYARAHQLQWVEDDTNFELHFNRNYLRHEVIPILKKRWPQISQSLSRSAKLCAESQELLENLADLDLENIEEASGLNCDRLLELSWPRQKNALRRWIHRQGFILPNAKHLEQIRKNCLASRPDAHPLVNWGRASIRRHRRRLELSDAQSFKKLSAIHES